MKKNMKQCYFCTNNVKTIDHKSTDLLKRFLDDFAKIGKRRDTGVCAKHQRKLATAVKRARFLALLPFVAD